MYFKNFIFPNISRSKDNQTMKFGKLIEDKVRNSFIQKLLQKMKQGDKFQTSFCF